MKGVKGSYPIPTIVRLLTKVTIDDRGCWVYNGSLQERGHGILRIGSQEDNTSKLVKAHRFSYEYFIGKIPDDLSLDHLCQNPSCVNPYHLEPVTRGENVKREAERRKTCHKGHLWILENIKVLPNGDKTCRLCWDSSRKRNKDHRNELKRINYHKNKNK